MASGKGAWNTHRGKNRAFSYQQGRSVTAGKRDGRAFWEAAQVLARSYTDTATAAKHIWPKRTLADAAL